MEGITAAGLETVSTRRIMTAIWAPHGRTKQVIKYAPPTAHCLTERCNTLVLDNARVAFDFSLVHLG